ESITMNPEAFAAGVNSREAARVTAVFIARRLMSYTSWLGKPRRRLNANFKPALMSPCHQATKSMPRILPEEPTCATGVYPVLTRNCLGAGDAWHRPYD